MRLIDADALKESLRESKDKLWEIYNRTSDPIDKRICAGQIGTFQEAILRIKDATTIDAMGTARRPVVGYEGYYEVDQFGRVYGMGRVITVKDGDRVYEKPLSGKQMKQRMHSAGYKTVALTKNGKTKAQFVHRLVAEAFLPNPDGLPMVNHKDEDKTNNFIENLEWCTVSYNNTYGNAVERRAKKIRGRTSEKRKAVIQRELDGSFVDWHESLTKAAKKINGCSSALSLACKGKRNTAYGYRWEYDAYEYGERRNIDV